MTSRSHSGKSSWRLCGSRSSSWYLALTSFPRNGCSASSFIDTHSHTHTPLIEAERPFLGKEVGTNDHDADLLPRRRQLDILERGLGAIYIGAETCKLGANNNGAKVRVHFLNSNQKERSCENLSQKGSKSKKDGQKHLLHYFAL
jgi:hypothetical protein